MNEWRYDYMMYYSVNSGVGTPGLYCFLSAAPEIIHDEAYNIALL